MESKIDQHLSKDIEVQVRQSISLKNELILPLEEKRFTIK